MKKGIIQVAMLVILSACIYLAQILIFHDPRTTAFYIFQDLAFVPISIAITVIAVGAIMDAHEKRDTLRKTAMLKSSFFSEVGSAMLNEFLTSVKLDPALNPILTDQDEHSVMEKHHIIETSHVYLDMNEHLYSSMMNIVETNKTQLLVISSNPLLIDQECFTQLLWSIFHLADEFRLRGTYEELSMADCRHMKKDFTDTFKLLLMSYTDNNEYLKRQYPSYYHAAITKIRDSSAQIKEDK